MPELPPEPPVPPLDPEEARRCSEVERNLRRTIHDLKEQLEDLTSDNVRVKQQLEDELTSRPRPGRSDKHSNTHTNNK